MQEDADACPTARSRCARRSRRGSSSAGPARTCAEASVSWRRANSSRRRPWPRSPHKGLASIFRAATGRGWRSWPPGTSSSRPECRCPPAASMRAMAPCSRRFAPSPGRMTAAAGRGTGRPRRDARSLIARGLAEADALVVAGGMSVGERDFVKEALAAEGVQADLWRVAMKPGKPFLFGRGREGQAVFGLPGNPVSAFVTFLDLRACPRCDGWAVPPSRTLLSPRSPAVAGEPLAQQGLSPPLAARPAGPRRVPPHGPAGVARARRAAAVERPRPRARRGNRSTRARPSGPSLW